MGALEPSSSGVSTHERQQQHAHQIDENPEPVQFPPQKPEAFPIPPEHQQIRDEQMQYLSGHDNLLFPTNPYTTPSPNPIPNTSYAPPWPQPQPQPQYYTGQPPNNVPMSCAHLGAYQHQHQHQHHHQYHQVLTAPPMFPAHYQVPTELWTTGLFDCMDDPMNALITFCIPCLTFGQIAEIIDNGNTSCATSGLIYGAILFLIGCPCILSCTYRTKLRSRFNLVESVGPDWISHFLCECCAISQEYRELKNRGFDPSIGWHANVVRSQQHQLAMVPPGNQTMRG